jgi:hypothetical protein
MPSKLRSISEAATESYAGRDMDPHADRPGVLASPAQMPTSSLRAARTDPDSYQSVVPNLAGTLTLDDLFSSDDSDTAAPFETGARFPDSHASSSTPAPSIVAGTVGEPAPSGPSGLNVFRTSEPVPLGASEGHLSSLLSSFHYTIASLAPSENIPRRLTLGYGIDWSFFGIDNMSLETMSDFRSKLV